MTEVNLNGRSLSGRLYFEREVVALRPKLLRFARLLTQGRDEAEDLVQETYIKALSNWYQFQPGTNLSAWLFTVMRNFFLSNRRRSWRVLPLDQEAAERTIVDPGVNQEEQLGFNQEFMLIAPLLGLLPPDMRDSVVAVHYLGIKYEDLAVILECAVGTAKSRVSRGIDSLQALIANGSNDGFDLSPWAHAAQNVPRDHPYYPIAKAYEEIYLFLATHDGRLNKGVPANSAPQSSEADALWQELLASDSFDDEDDLDALMRHDLEPY